jgi:outer membrane protein
MRGVVIAASLALVLSAAPAYAQAPAQPAAQASEQAKPPAPFPQGAKLAFVNLQAIAQLSAEGKAAQTKVDALTKEKQNEIAEKTKTLQANQQKLQTGGSVLSDQARLALERDIQTQTRDLERLQQDAQDDLNDLQQRLQAEFQKRLFPILEQLANEKSLHFLFSAADAGLIWAAEGLDLTLEAVKKLDGAK